eukprot:jgi/Picre1/32053/NNA_007401.t1
MFAAFVSTVLGAAVPEEREQNSWTEGVAIWVAVLVVSLVGAWNDWHKDKQFHKLNARKDVLDIKVVRDGVETLIISTDIVVGDVVLLDTGDKVAADMYMVESFGLTADESSLTGRLIQFARDKVRVIVGYDLDLKLVKEVARRL